MERKVFDAVTVITALVLLPMVALSAYAFWRGMLSFDAYAAMWREPLALLLGFWLRDMGRMQ